MAPKMLVFSLGAFGILEHLLFIKMCSPLNNSICFFLFLSRIRIAKTRTIDYGIYECRSDSHWAILNLYDEVPNPIDSNDEYFVQSNEPEMMSQRRLSDESKKDDTDDYPDEEDEEEDDDDPIDNQAPHFIEQPSQLHVKAVGQSVRLKCLAKGTPEPNVTWSKDGEELNRVGDMHPGTLFVPDLQTRDAGNYTCNVCNTIGCITFTTQLRIKSDVDEQSTTDDTDLVLNFNTIF